MLLPTLMGKKGLIVGIANEHSIAWGCAQAMHAWGAQLAITYWNEKAEPFVRPLAASINAEIILPCDVQNPEQMTAVFDMIRARWGTLDFLVHSIAYAPKEDLRGRLTDCSLTGFNLAMDVSCHSFVRLARLAEPLMNEGGSLLTVSYYGSEKAVEHYAMMGPIKAALESSVRYLAVELGIKKIRVNALSPGAIRTRAASGLADFDSLIEQSRRKSPLKRLIDLEDIGQMAAFLCSNAAKNITGEVHYIDAGYEIVD